MNRRNEEEKPLILSTVTSYSGASDEAGLMEKWLQNRVFNPPQPTFLEQLAGYIGFGVGALGSYVMYPLGKEFGITFVHLINQILKNWNMINASFDDEGEWPSQAFGIFFGVITTISVVGLCSIAGMERFRELARPKQSYDAEVTNPKAKNARIAMDVFHYFFIASAGAIPQLALTLEYPTGLWLDWLIVPCSFLAPYFLNSGPFSALLDRCWNWLTLGKRDQDERKKLLAQLSTISKAIKKADDEKIKDLSGTLISDDQVSTKVEALGDMQADHSNWESISLVESTSPIARIFALLFGLSGAYVYYAVAEEYADKWWSNKSLAVFVGLMSYLANGALAAEKTEHAITAKGHFQRLSSLRRVRQWANRLGDLFGPISASSLLYVQINFALQAEGSMRALMWLLVVPTAIAPAIVRRFGVQNLLNLLITSANEFFHPDGVSTQRDRCVEMVGKISSRLGYLGHGQVSKMHALFNSGSHVHDQELSRAASTDAGSPLSWEHP